MATFRIFASGGYKSGFYYVKNDIDEGDAIDRAYKVVAAIEGDYSTAANRANTAREIYGADGGDAHAAAQALGRIVFSDTVQGAIKLLAAANGGADGYVSVYSQEKNLLFSDTVRTMKQLLDTDDAPYNFMKQLQTVLTATNIYNAGPLSYVNKILWAYSSLIDKNKKTPKLNIQIFS